MSYEPTTDPKFLATLSEWIGRTGEVLLLIRFSHAAGSKSYEFFTSIDALQTCLRSLPARTCVTAFHDLQLPIRGVVDDAFVEKCGRYVPDGAEYLITALSLTVGKYPFFRHRNGESHKELREDLLDLSDTPVAFGFYPPWLEESDRVISAVVPDENGNVQTGVY